MVILQTNFLFLNVQRLTILAILFLEPGYYEKGQFGIRIEDIVQIVPAKVENDFNGRGALTFKTVTMCPIQTKLIDKELLTEKEVISIDNLLLKKNSTNMLKLCENHANKFYLQKTHLNNYHAKVRETLTPLLQAEGDNSTIQWLEKETQPI